MPSLAGQVAIVTGANSGLGFAATQALIEHDATVVMAVRSIERGRAAAEEIAAAVSKPVSIGVGTAPDGDRGLDIRQCDLADLDSVQSFASGVQTDYPSVDILCNNAGVMAIPRQETEDGFEMQLGVNHFGHFALTGQLFPQLHAGDQTARVVTQSSGAHQAGSLDFADLNWEHSYSKWGAYARSKLANLLFAYELQRRIEAAGIETVMSVASHPGYADTNLQARTARTNDSRLLAVGLRLANRLIGQSPADGALPMLYAATAPDIEGGEYIGPGGLLNMRGSPTRQDSSETSYDEELAATLWERSEAATGVTYPFDRDG